MTGRDFTVISPVFKDVCLPSVCQSVCCTYSLSPHKAFETLMHCRYITSKYIL